MYKSSTHSHTHKHRGANEEFMHGDAEIHEYEDMLCNYASYIKISYHILKSAAQLNRPEPLSTVSFEEFSFLCLSSGAVQKKTIRYIQSDNILILMSSLS